MHANVLNFEPHSALFVQDENPLIFYKEIARIAEKRLLHGGLLYVEINENFGNEVALIFTDAGLSESLIIRDIHEKNRFVRAVKM
jgi:release factor glutamine methyltransferase